MRSLSLAGIVGITALTVGCVSSDSDLVYRGTLDTETQGVVLYEDGATGHAAMSGTTCSLDTSGNIAYDIDLDGNDDRVLDGTRDDGGAVVLARSRDTLHVITGTSSWSWGEEFEVTSTRVVQGLTGASVSRDGFVAYGDCQVTWLDGSLQVLDTASVPLADCAGTFAADRASGTAFVANGSEIAVVNGAVVDLIADRGDLMTWAGATGALVVAQTDGSDVRALDLDGSLRWSTTLDGAVTQLADLGGKGVAVMVRTGGTGALVLLDADTGAEQRRFELPGAVPFTAAPNGSSLAMVVGARVHFYQLR